MRLFLLALAALVAGCVTALPVKSGSNEETSVPTELESTEETSAPTEPESTDESTAGLISNSMEGTWTGELTLLVTPNLESEVSGNKLDILLLNCDGPVEIWSATDDSSFSKMGDDYQLISHRGNHLLSEIDSGGAWVETQSWGIISLSSNKAYVQRNRLVSNPLADVNDEHRYHGQFAFGEIERIAMDCDVWKESSEEQD